MAVSISEAKYSHMRSGKQADRPKNLYYRVLIRVSTICLSRRGRSKSVVAIVPSHSVHLDGLLVGLALGVVLGLVHLVTNGILGSGGTAEHILLADVR